MIAAAHHVLNCSANWFSSRPLFCLAYQYFFQFCHDNTCLQIAVIEAMLSDQVFFAPFTSLENGAAEAALKLVKKKKANHDVVRSLHAFCSPATAHAQNTTYIILPVPWAAVIPYMWSWVMHFSSQKWIWKRQSVSRERWRLLIHRETPTLLDSDIVDWFSCRNSRSVGRRFRRVTQAVNKAL